jgi:hypothetical protein
MCPSDGRRLCKGRSWRREVSISDGREDFHLETRATLHSQRKKATPDVVGLKEVFGNQECEHALADITGNARYGMRGSRNDQIGRSHLSCVLSLPRINYLSSSGVGGGDDFDFYIRAFRHRRGSHRQAREWIVFWGTPFSLLDCGEPRRSVGGQFTTNGMATVDRTCADQFRKAARDYAAIPQSRIPITTMPGAN